MKFINFTTPKTLAVRPYNKNEVIEGKNKLVWFHPMKTSIEINRLELHPGKIMATSAIGSVYTILTSKSKNTDKGFVILSDKKTLTELWDALNDVQPDLQWKPFRNIEKQLSAPTDENLQQVINSFGNQERIIKEIVNGEAKVEKQGLRPPQIAAIYAILSSWAVSDKITTVVLPTGTGKSETILGTLSQKKSSEA